ncbi:Hypothetical predicted protein [Olea europaea subsp. europaea]|uniref:Uncharacterized protein n=1 Tax=Olea europaea subsp. europaea TaxID=158383 RepID=A0A8S0S1T5_OLEEU|nr:Hypothetical predicted protein [Olea europaea subsp. europaea]
MSHGITTIIQVECIDELRLLRGSAEVPPKLNRGAYKAQAEALQKVAEVPSKMAKVPLRMSTKAQEEWSTTKVVALNSEVALLEFSKVVPTLFIRCGLMSSCRIP